MGLQLSVAVRNAQLDAIEVAAGPSPVMEIRSGPQPANCAAVDTGDLLASLPLPVDWMAAAAGGSKAKSGLWEDLAASATGPAGHWRIKNTALSVCHLQGSVSIGGGGGQLQLDTIALVLGADVLITSFVITQGNV